jgi:hypothetical protein
MSIHLGGLAAFCPLALEADVCPLQARFDNAVFIFVGETEPATPLPSPRAWRKYVQACPMWSV